MSPGLLRHLVGSREVRTALARDFIRYAIALGSGLAIAAAVRHFLLNKEALSDDMLMFVAVWSVIWLVSATRTARAVLREHGEID